MGKHLEALVCSDVRDQVIEQNGREQFLTGVQRAVNSLTPSIRKLANREKNLDDWIVSKEDDVRDLLYVMLRALVSDIRTEEAVPSKAGTHKFVDLFSDIAKCLIEVKWVGRKGQWKSILDEIWVDIQTYVRHPSCKHIVFIVVDAAKDIPDPYHFEQEISGKQMIDGKEVMVTAYVREP